MSPSPQTIRPTEEFYSLLNQAFDHFNDELFDRNLPSCLLTVQRESNTLGYFSPDRWGNREGLKAHEIAMNPAYFASHSLIEVLQTLVHEQCHLWQQVFGQRKSRTGYHNREWAAKMESIGLMPSHSGLPGGKRTGQQMSDYPLPGGRFLNSCENLVKNGFVLSWIDRIPATNDCSQVRGATEHIIEHPENEELELILHTRIEELVPDITPLEVVLQDKVNKNKTTYRCEQCDNKVWGKPGLEIACVPCEKIYTEVSFLVSD